MDSSKASFSAVPPEPDLTIDSSGRAVGALGIRSSKLADGRIRCGPALSKLGSFRSMSGRIFLSKASVRCSRFSSASMYCGAGLRLRFDGWSYVQSERYGQRPASPYSCNAPSIRCGPTIAVDGAMGARLFPITLDLFAPALVARPRDTPAFLHW